MTVAAEIPLALYDGDGVTTAFPAPWRYLEVAHLRVELVASTGVATPQTLGLDYSATLGSTDAGGTVTMVTAPASGQQLRIGRATPLAQTTAYPTSGAFPAASHGLALDRQMLALQEQAEALSRAPKVLPGQTALPIDMVALANGQVLARVGDEIVGVDNDPAAAEDAAARAVTALTGALTAQVASEAAADEGQAFAEGAAASEGGAALSAAAASLHEAAAQAYASGFLFENTADPLTNGVVGIAMTANGATGTNGTFTGTFTGGGGSGATFRFVVAAGAVVPASIVILNRGVGYATTPTAVFSASAGLAGAAATITTGARTTDGDYLLVIGAGDTYADLYRNVAGTITDQNLAIPSRAYLLAVTGNANDLLDGFDLELLTGDGSTGVTVADGTTLAAGVLRVVAMPQYDTTYTQLDFWCKVTGAAPGLVCLRRNKAGTWDYHSQTGAGPSRTSGAARSWTFSFKVPGGGVAGDTAVCTYETAGRLAGAAVDTQVVVIADPTTASGIAFSSLANRPNVALTGTYSQITDKGTVKRSLDAVPPRSPNGVYFVTKGNTAIIREAIDGVRRRTGSAKILMAGSSIERGSHTGTNGALGTYGYTGAYDRCFTAQLQSMLSGYYQVGGPGLFLPCQYEGFRGYGNIQGTYPAYNPRVSQGAWTTVGSVPYTSVGGGFFKSTTIGGAPLVLAPTKPVDTFKYSIPKNSGFGEIRHRLDSGGWTTKDLYSANAAYEEFSVTTTLDLHTTEVEHLSGAEVYLIGVDAFDSTLPSLRFMNCGFSGSTAGVSWAQVVAAPWSPGVLFGALDAHLVQLPDLTNDIDDGYSISDMMTGYDTLYQSRYRTANVVARSTTPLRTDDSTGAAQNGSGTPFANRSLARQRAVNAALFEWCGDNSVPLIDMYGWFGEPDTAVNTRFPGAPLVDDQLHPPYSGHTIMAQGWFEFLKAVSGA